METLNLPKQSWEDSVRESFNRGATTIACYFGTWHSKAEFEIYWAANSTFVNTVLEKSNF